jgi:hypothetical protein
VARPIENLGTPSAEFVGILKTTLLLTTTGSTSLFLLISPFPPSLGASMDKRDG